MDMDIAIPITTIITTHKIVDGIIPIIPTTNTITNTITDIGKPKNNYNLNY